MTPGFSKDIQCHVWPYFFWTCTKLQITRLDIRQHIKWAVSLVIAYCHFNFPQGFVWVCPWGKYWHWLLTIMMKRKTYHKSMASYLNSNLHENDRRYYLDNTLTPDPSLNSTAVELIQTIYKERDLTSKRNKKWRENENSKSVWIYEILMNPIQRICLT